MLKRRGIGVAVLLVASGMPALAQDPSPAEQAISLLQASLQCPSDQYTSSGAPYDLRLDRSAAFTGKGYLVIYTGSDHLTTPPGEPPDHWHDDINSQILITDIGDVTASGVTITIDCAGHWDCVQISGNRPRSKRRFDKNPLDWESKILVRACDGETADNIKMALDALKSYRKQ
jgi:hypothetical protein